MRHARLFGAIPVELGGLLRERPLTPLLLDSLEPFVFEAVVAEHIDRAGHTPDFVAARRVRNGDGPVGARQRTTMRVSSTTGAVSERASHRLTARPPTTASRQPIAERCMACAASAFIPANSAVEASSYDVDRVRRMPCKSWKKAPAEVA